MDSHRFDILAQRLGAAGSRRQTLAALVAGTIAYLYPRSGANDAAAKCKGYKGKCKKKSSCCKHGGLKCRRDRCRCKKGWKHCPGTGDDCTNVKADHDNCGACGNECPPATPCCINGSCQELCGGSCCADCFVDKLEGIPQANTETCCGPGSGTFCSSKKHDSSDDECCWTDQECVNGQCCCDGCLGAVICGGTCCAGASCCNGQCCPAGQVCSPTGQTCVPANRGCEGPANCLDGEDCVGGVCCAGDRICGDVCCIAGEYCDTLDEDNIGCCEINTTCKGTWRGHRVRR